MSAELDLDELETLAKKQSAAHATMIEIGYGIGALAQECPDMFRDMQDWDDLTENDHADTVLALLAVIRELEATK